MSEAEPKSRQRRKEARPGEILEAAFEEFALKGFAATRLDDVATRAGITKGTIYVYFPSKEELFVATFKETAQPVLDHLTHATANPKGPALEILRTYFHVVYDALVRSRRGRELLRMLMAEGIRFPNLTDRWHDEVIAPVNARLADLVRYGIDRGELRPVAMSEFFHLMMAPVLSASTWRSLFGEKHALDLEIYFEGHLDMLERTLLVSPKAAGG